MLFTIRAERQLLRRAAQWIYYYNVERSHMGEGMEGEGKSLWQKLVELGVEVPREFALFMPVILDRISTDWVLGPGNDLLAHYRSGGFVDYISS